MFGPACYSDPPDDGLEDYPDYLGNLSDEELYAERVNAKDYCANPKVLYLIHKEMGERVAAAMLAEDEQALQEIRSHYATEAG